MSRLNPTAMLRGTVLVVLAGGVAAALAGSVGAAQRARATKATTLALTASKTAFAFNKKQLTAPAGKITITLRNPAGFEHGISVGSKKGNVVGTGGTARVTVTLKKGTYTYFCQVGKHRDFGMKGTLTVK